MREKKNKISDFKLVSIIEDIKALLINGLSNEDDLSDIEWLIRVLLMSKDVFGSVKEVDIFLSNMTGLQHDTKSTGRDRIIDWYFRQIDSMGDEKKNKVLYKISKYLFINFSSNYKGWKNTLYKGKK